MSVLIKGINITMTQGDTLNLPISIYYKDENGETIIDKKLINMKFLKISFKMYLKKLKHLRMKR